MPGKDAALPEGQSSQTLDILLLNFPGSHRLQLIAPAVLEYRPGAQSMQDGFARSANVEGLQLVQLSARPSDHEPRVQLSHDLLRLFVPGGQSSHLTAPSLGAAVPDGQSKHTELLATGECFPICVEQRL